VSFRDDGPGEGEAKVVQVPLRIGEENDFQSRLQCPLPLALASSSSRSARLAPGRVETVHALRARALIDVANGGLAMALERAVQRTVPILAGRLAIVRAAPRHAKRIVAVPSKSEWSRMCPSCWLRTRSSRDSSWCAKSAAERGRFSDAFGFPRGTL